ncbi:MAG: hypothetical protein U1A24_17705 [Cypionkella sp.]|uniref:hypothetical protein n=1 Tax=Cypionkella sp. TaxID=2811411 RepID=UPI002ABC902B|nr:hypothetical protein [Cypionkella sp.]MDZ4312387.1 hypothetical protein [Cypionkella sp.]
MQSGAVLIALALATPAPAQSIIVQLVPNADPDAVIYCAIRLQDRQISTVATKGLGFQNLRPYHWWANPAEDRALLHSVASFLTGDIPSANPLSLPRLQPPYLTVDWRANVDGSLASGRYQAQGTTLPAPLRHLIATVMPGSYCAHGLND